MIEYQRSYQNIRQQMQEISPALAEQTEFIKQQTLDRLVERILLLDIKNELGFMISDNQVRSAILEIPAFQNPEGFNSVAYQNFLLTQGYTPALFEAEIKEDLTLEQLQAGIIQTTIVPPDEARHIASLERQTRDIQYGSVTFNSFEDVILVSDAEMEEYYNQNSASFMSPEQLRVSYIYLSLEDIAADVTADEDQIRTYFDSNRQNYSITERRKVRQLLVYSDTEDVNESASNIANQIYDLLNTSESSFDDVVNQFDSDQITVESSDFGYLNQGVLDPEVDEVVFGLEPGVISQPIETEYGYQIVVVDDITGGDRPEFEQVSGEVETDFRREQAEVSFFELYDELSVLTYENPDTLEIASESLGLPVMQGGTITRLNAEDPLLNNQRVISAAFSDDVLIEGNNSELIEVNTDQIVVIRVTDHQSEQVRPYEDVQEVIRQRLRFQKGTVMTQQRGQEIMSRLESGSQLAEIEDEYSIIWATRIAMDRNDTNIDRQIVETAFTAGTPSEGESVYGGVSLLSGDYVVVMVTAVHDVDPALIPDEEVTQIQVRLMQNQASRTWSSIIGDLRSNADIEIYEDNL
jgi:peptidyl-prolyl cis-trans isomerase D